MRTIAPPPKDGHLAEKEHNIVWWAPASYAEERLPLQSAISLPHLLGVTAAFVVHDHFWAMPGVRRIKSVSDAEQRLAGT